MYHFLDFEKSISILEGKIEELRNISSKDGMNIGLEVSKLEEQLEKKLGIMVFSSNQTLIWDTIRSTGYNSPISGYGKLLEN